MFHYFHYFEKDEAPSDKLKRGFIELWFSSTGNNYCRFPLMVKSASRINAKILAAKRSVSSGRQGVVARSSILQQTWWQVGNRKKIDDYLRFLTHAGETRFPILACESLSNLSHYVSCIGLMLTSTLKIVQTIPDPMRQCTRFQLRQLSFNGFFKKFREVKNFKKLKNLN